MDVPVHTSSVTSITVSKSGKVNTNQTTTPYIIFVGA